MHFVKEDKALKNNAIPFKKSLSCSIILTQIISMKIQENASSIIKNKRHPNIKGPSAKYRRLKTITFCFCFTCCVTIVLRSASGGPVNLLTAGTVCRRIVWLPPCPIVWVRPGAPDPGAGPIRSNWNCPLSDFSNSVEPCWPGCRCWIAFCSVIYNFN